MKNVMDEQHNPKCAAAHCAPWLVEPRWMSERVEAYKAGLLPMANAEAVVEGNRLLYAVDDGGIATVGLNGAMMKGDSKFGGTSTVRTRRAIRMAAADSDVKGIMLAVDSPGGTVSGTDELAADIRAVRSKPLHVHGEGDIASAAYWTAIQGHRLTASRMSQVGSIGVIMVVDDVSGRFEKAGIKTHVITNKEATLKGAFVGGAEIGDEALAYAQEMADTIFMRFKAEVKGRRDMDSEAFSAVSSGRVWVAPKAKELGLIDAVETRDQAMSALRAEVLERETASAKRGRRMTRLQKSANQGVDIGPDLV